MNVGRIRDEKITLSSDFSNGCLFLYDLAWSSLRSLSSHAVFPCPSHQRSSLWFLECHRGIFHTSQLVIILCSPLRYSTRRPNLSLCVTFVFLLCSSLFVQLTFPSFFHCDLLAFVPGCTTLSPHPPSPPPSPLLPWVPLWKTLFPGSVCFRERGETRPDRTWHKWFKEQSDPLIFDNQCDTRAFKISTRNVWFLFCSVIGPLAEINFPLRAAPVCHYGTCSCVPRVS